MKNLRKQLVYVLRHNPQSVGIIPDENGYCNVVELIKKLNDSGANVSFAALDEIVKNDKKHRFSFDADKTRIRANYGHSFPVDLNLQSVKPPEVLYHGTAKENVEKILSSGILKVKRNFVHLSCDYLTAFEVGKRYGVPFVFEVDSQKMAQDGYVFYHSGEVWLTEYVPAKYAKPTNKM